MITEPSNANYYECMLENFVMCGQDISRREKTDESQTGDVKCVTLGYQELWVCNPLVSNDGNIEGYDFLRVIDTDSNDAAANGDSGSGWHEDVLLNGITKGHTGFPENNTYYTHAYYIEWAPYLGLTTVCGTSGVCNN